MNSWTGDRHRPSTGNKSTSLSAKLDIPWQQQDRSQLIHHMHRIDRGIHHPHLDIASRLKIIGSCSSTWTYGESNSVTGVEKWLSLPQERPILLVHKALQTVPDRCISIEAAAGLYSKLSRKISKVMNLPIGHYRRTLNESSFSTSSGTPQLLQEQCRIVVFFNHRRSDNNSRNTKTSSAEQNVGHDGPSSFRLAPDLQGIPCTACERSLDPFRAVNSDECSMVVVSIMTNTLRESWNSVSAANGSHTNHGLG